MTTAAELLHLHAGYAPRSAQELHAAAGLRVKADDTGTSDERVKKLIEAGGLAVAALAARLASGTLSRAAFVEQALAVIQEHAQQAAGIGAAQFDADPDPDTISAFVSGQEDYLDGFGADIQAARLSGAQIAARGALYGGALWSVYQMGRGDGAKATGIEQAWWDLDPDAQHCADCPGLADGSPYAYPDELPTFPGIDVECGSNCRCALRFETGEGGTG